MKIRKAIGTLSVPSLLILGFATAMLSFSIIAKNSGLFASATSFEESSEDGEQSFITIYDGNEKTTLRSGATTVRELLKRAGITYGEYDTVEPGLDEDINFEYFNINIYRSREALVIDNNIKKYVRTSATEPDAVVADAGMKLLDADTVEIVPYNNLLESGITTAYQIKRAKTIKFDFYGKEMLIRTQADTIGEFLKERNIKVDSKDVWASLRDETLIEDNMSFAVYRQGKQTKTVEQDIAFNTKTTYDYSLAYGAKKIITQGQKGKQTVTYEINMRNGKEISRKVLSSIVTKKPIDQQVKIGMKVDLPAGTHNDWMAKAGISSSDYGYVNYIIERESHWNPLAKNRSSGATGLCQALPGNKMASAGSDWATNPITQLRWCNGYAVGRYGSWAKAYQFWTSHHWW